jgi:hypothetical protein
MLDGHLYERTALLEEARRLAAEKQPQQPNKNP